MGQLDGKAALVTGGSSGIGLATAIRLAADGAHVFITGRRQPELDRAVTLIGSATAIAGDISEPADLDRLYSIIEFHGRGLDIVFANAAAASTGVLEVATLEQFDRIFNVNVRGTLLTVQKALPLLNPGASVILTSSTAADRGAEGLGLYAASKAAIRSLARTLANELKERGIRVNSVSPGPFDTPGIANLVGEENAAATNAATALTIPLGRVGRAEEAADAVAFLASDQSSFIIGANLYVDGGLNQI